MKNKDYEKRVRSIIIDKAKYPITLKDYLVNFSFEIENYKEGITAEKLIYIVSNSFMSNYSIEIDSLVNIEIPNINNPDNTYEAFRNVILTQIYDLDMMERSSNRDRTILGTGYSSPRGRKWYNFRTEDYIECSASWVNDYYGEESILSTDWTNLIRLFEMGRLYE